MIGKIQKPEGANWTDDQWDAISIRGHSMLVAAAAGSGKTAVLVERIIRRIADEQDPVDVDRLLVATFTKAAAAEMRHRISEALEKALAREPGSDHLRRQLALIQRASITTLHSFCMEVIGRYHQLIGLDPGFRIANETESALMRQDILEELLEERYGLAEEGDAFWRLADTFSGDKSDAGLFQLIQRLYDDSRSHPWPNLWLREQASAFESGLASDDHPWLTSLRASVKLELLGVQALLQEAAALTGEPGGPEPYMANLEDDMTVVSYLLERVQAPGWDVLYHAFQGAAFGKLKACKGDAYDKALQEQVKELRNEAKERLGKVKEELFVRTLEQFDAELKDMAPLMVLLTELVIAFGERYGKAKMDKSLVDFSDLEHFCLRILCSEDAQEGQLSPSSSAMDYREQFVEVLLDEYQDTNRVQEAIVELISRQSPGNRFMVGDVKQSIYRFRLAEPGLFQEKYKSFRKDEPEPGQRIDLARNFRSRRQVVDGTNYIFHQVMNEAVGEIAYDDRAELVYGAGYPDDPEPGRYDAAAELILIDRTAGAEDAAGSAASEEDANRAETADGTEDAAAEHAAEEARDLDAVQLEARYIGARIRTMLGMDGGQPMRVFDKAQGMRAATFRDVVILLRATQQWAPVMIEELKQMGIPAYAELSTGYFTATEVQVLISLLRIIDNPYQDIPLAAVLRSPIIGLSASDLARIRIYSRHSAFYDAVRAYAKEEAEEGKDPGLMKKLSGFLQQLRSWRQQAQMGSLADLVWDIYRQTHYFDFVGGLPGGQQRQANLRALYDRARQYEATSFRGLFRFLRFIERMQLGGGDLGTARALGEQEDVVRIMTIHKSKGLEFPVVFVAGLAKSFNRRELTDPFLLHKELGFGPKTLDLASRVSYPTLPWLAIKRKIQLEMLAEEMRVLYVALTRAREKLFLVGSVKGGDKLAASWARYVRHEGRELPDDALAKARCYLDWIGPAIIRHPDGELLREAAGIDFIHRPFLANETSEWRVELLSPDPFAALAEAAPTVMAAEDKLQSVLRLEPVSETERWEQEVWRRLSWTYPHQQTTKVLSKTSVTELKRLSEHHKLMELLMEEPEVPVWTGADASPDTDTDTPPAPSAPASLTAAGGTVPAGGGSYRPAIVRRPRFLEERKANAAERGTVFHSVMQHIPLSGSVDEAAVRMTLDRMAERELLTDEQRPLVDPAVIVSFFESVLGRRLLQAAKVHREVPFSYGVPAKDVYGAGSTGLADETVMLQGVIDCVFEEEAGLVLLDYKTDRLKGSKPERIAEGYRLQLDLYARAVETIWKRPVIGKYLFLFDGAHIVEL
ncbi:helicase-exonuclease AddAB subunit AddA [Paenibacillus filicis]|uniref:ATP-dependent helicase/nuclease subunit A n=1 Tax=Paenibacillus gyeongsangnamensis TaxID=3388067 RepID=A0ABT4Q2Q4_9BACL|nr:helicase-exonuclease AddAB subunit AddA [Paenibacillus filicis]MCZ8511164.1 helicase-exonuclease AddAB subunit AddA [Paenibacillus filicis]